jgi:DNA-binding MarR family transcriptional regulator
MSILLSALWDPDWTLSMRAEGGVYPSQFDIPGLSHSLLLGLLVFACFPPDGAYRRVAEIARTLNMRPSTAHRYMTTLTAVGLLEREPHLRKYRSARIG